MGANIKFIKGKKEFYFRDSYNLTNLAWVIGLSYWETKKPKENYKLFFNKLAKITDSQITNRVKLIFETEKGIQKNETQEGWIAVLKEKRDLIKANLEIINKATKIEWSV